MCDNAVMTDHFDITVLRRNLSLLMQKNNLAPTTLSTMVKKSNPSLVKNLMESTADVKLSTIYNLAEVLDVSISDILFEHLEVAEAGPRLFVKGEVAAGEWVEAFEWPMDDWIALSGRADITAELEHRFFLRVAGDSMNLVYPEGSYIECVSTFGRAEAVPGKRVVVLRTREDNLVEATVKEMVEIDGEIWFKPNSTNPRHQAFPASDPGPGIREVRVIAVVVSSIRPE